MRGGLLIRQARRRGRLTQTQLAERLGSTQSAIARWESGKAEPSFHSVVRAVRACGFDFVPQLLPRDESEERMIDYHLSLTTMQRAAALEELLRVGEQARTTPRG
ncbi:MAG TPA: helix-turn-helix transcriptional regulator [Egibacteraceae bacterium]|nr:helix-turn-helix transcriptional regulator [Egibacteraceae bacterium]